MSQPPAAPSSRPSTPLAMKVVAVPDPSTAGERFEHWVTRPAALTIEALRQSAAAMADRSHVVVWIMTPPEDEQQAAFAEAACESVRGIVQSVTREFAGKMRPLNAVVADRDDEVSLREALEYLSGQGGRFTAGSTLDLRGAGSEPA